MKLIVIDVQKGITDERLYDFDGFIRNVTSCISVEDAIKMMETDT